MRDYLWVAAYYALTAWDVTLDFIEDTTNDILDWMASDTGLDYLTTFCFCLAIGFLIASIAGSVLFLIPSVAWSLVGFLFLSGLFAEAK